MIFPIDQLVKEFHVLASSGVRHDLSRPNMNVSVVVSLGCRRVESRGPGGSDAVRGRARRSRKMRKGSEG